MQASTNRQWIPLSLAFALAISGAVSPVAFAAGTTTTVNQANLARQNREAEQLSAQGQFSEAAAKFEALAAQSTSPEREHFLLKAARNTQLMGNDAKAQTLVAQISKLQNPQDAALRAVINAATHLRNSLAERAITELDQIPLPMPDELAADALTVRVHALFAAGRTVPAVSTAVERERSLKTDFALSQNRQLIWDNLKQAAVSGKDLTPPAGANKTTAGWLELAKLFAAGQRDPFAFNRTLADWRNRYSGHPGSSLLNANPASPAINVSNTSNQIALLLPLSGKQLAAGTAIRDGFMAGLLQMPADKRPKIQMFDTNALGAIAAYQQATADGAGMIVGPLLKEDVEALANSQQVGTLTLALNALTDEQLPPALMFQFSLDPEEEARQVVQRARNEGHTNAIVLTPNNEWGQRVQRAFAQELKLQGGTLVDQRNYDPAARDYVSLARQLFAPRKPAQTRALDSALGNTSAAERRDDFDYIFVAAQVAQAKQLRPALRFVLPDNSIPIYATSDSYEPESSNSDLEGLRFVDMPWVINRDSETERLHDAVTRAWSNSMRSRSRLYAFGIDALRLSSWLKTPQPQLASPLRGTTGLLALDQTGRVRRQADWAQIVNGKPQTLPDTSIIVR